ncbi:M23 family metallopeptidase [Candidatus Omnitrophota bacterium]
MLRHGESALLFVWIEIDDDKTVPQLLLSRVMYPEIGIASMNSAEYLLEVSDRMPVLISPPLEGEGWVGAGAPGPDSYHRRAALPMNGKWYVAQRFAVDWIQVDKEGKFTKGDPKKNESHYCFGKEIHAVADGIVTSVLDGLPENIPGEFPEVKTPDELEGNHIVTDIGGGNHVFYAHLQPGSLRVKKGDAVKKGQVIALLGNTGHSDAPHLHIHVCDGPDPVRSNGLPFHCEELEIVGKAENEADMKKGALSCVWYDSPVAARDDMPFENDIVDF